MIIIKKGVRWTTCVNDTHSHSAFCEQKRQNTYKVVFKVQQTKFYGTCCTAGWCRKPRIQSTSGVIWVILHNTHLSVFQWALLRDYLWPLFLFVNADFIGLAGGLNDFWNITQLFKVDWCTTSPGRDYWKSQL